MRRRNSDAPFTFIVMSDGLPPSAGQIALRRIRRWWLGGAFISVIAGCLLVLVFFRPESTVVSSKTTRPAFLIAQDMVAGDREILADARFVVTSNSPPPYIRNPIPGTGPADQTYWKRQEIRWQFQKPNPEKHSFQACEPRACSIHGFLSQCTEVTGVPFVIAKEVAAGSVKFGHTNTLNGVQWAKALTDALQAAPPEWWGSVPRRFRQENLILLSQDGRSVLVLPEEMAMEFRAKGFKDFRWSF